MYNSYKLIILKRILFKLLPKDSPKNSLSKVFWTQVDQVKHSAVKSRKLPLPQDGADCFREFAGERLVRSQRDKKQNCRAFQGLSNDVHEHPFKFN